MVKAVIFDVDGVIIDSLEANLKFFQDLMTAAGYKSPTRRDYRPYFHFPMWDVIKIFSKSSSEEEIGRIWDLGRKKIKYPNHLLSMNEDAEKIIKTLEKKYMLGIVTSRVKEGIDNVPVLSKLKKHFKAIVSYQDTKNHKPDPEPLLLACQKLRINPEEAVYIGDAESDIIAGKAADMKVILYSKKPLKGAELRVSLLKEIPDLIRNF